jgi:hypothetical protein
VSGYLPSSSISGKWIYHGAIWVVTTILSFDRINSKSYMKNSILFLLFWVVSMHGIFNANADPMSSSSIPTQTNMNSNTNKPHLLELEAEGISGNGDALQHLSLYYFGIGAINEAQYWSYLSAEDGGAENEFDYAGYLAMEQDTDSLVRSIFWMQTALKASDGDLKNKILHSLVIQNSLLSSTGNFCNIGFDDNKKSDITNIPRQPAIAENAVPKIFGDIVQLRIAALCGSPSAARSLVMYYGSKGATLQQIFFTTIGAENGDSMSQLDVAGILSQQLSDTPAQERAIFWAKRALSNARDIKTIQRAKIFLKSHIN